MRGTAFLWDLQMETARNLWRTQARAAALLGIPDYSELFGIGDERARRIFSSSAEQVLDTARQARDTVVEVQRQLGRLAEQQTIGLTEGVREHIEQIGRQTELGLHEIQQMTADQSDAVEDAVAQAGELHAAESSALASDQAPRDSAVPDTSGEAPQAEKSRATQSRATRRAKKGRRKT